MAGSARLAASAAVVAVAAVAVSDQRVVVGEVGLLEAVNDIPTALGWPLRIVMQLGTLWVGLAIVGVVAWRTGRRGLTPTVSTLAAVLVAFRADDLLKDLIERPRPEHLVSGLHVREHIDGYGFPSGHTTMAFALAGALHPMLPPAWRRVAWGLAVVVGLARLHVGVHLPMDVVGGAALGIAIGTLAWLLVGHLPSCWFEPPAAPGTQ